MADKFITLHPNDNGVIDNSTNVYPNIKAAHNILDENGNPIEVQEKLTNGTTIKTMRVGSPSATPENILGSGSIIVDFLNKLYPVGTIYTCSTRATISKDISDNPICPIQQILGGVWQPIYDTFLYASKKGTHSTSGDYFPGDTGGSKDAVLVEHNHGGVTGSAGAHTHTTNSIINLNNTSSKNLEGSFITRACGTDNAPMVKDGKGCVSISNNDPISAGLSVNLIGASGNPASDRVNIDTRHRHTTDAQGSHQHGITEVGESATGKNMPPYMAIFAWERIS